MKFVKIMTALVMMGAMQTACKVPAIVQEPAPKPLPASFMGSSDSSQTASLSWKQYFSDPYLVALIDTALKNNIEMQQTYQDIEIAQSNVRWQHGQLLPTVTAGFGMGLEKVGTYTSQGAGDASADIIPGKRVPEHLPDFFMGFRASWEADIWGKLHTAKKVAFTRYLHSVEGKNFVQTNLVAEIARSYYELLGLDTQLEIIRRNITLQNGLLEIAQVQKEAAVVTELAVKQFEAQRYNAQQMEYVVQQRIVETENAINLLLARYPQHIERNATTFLGALPAPIQEGLPVQLLSNRPDIRMAALELTASKLELTVAQTEFLPSLGLSGLLAFNAFRPSYWLHFPESFAYNLAGDFLGPIVNRHALIAHFQAATAVQKKALLEYQQTLYKGYHEVYNALSGLHNLEKQYELKSKEAATQQQSVSIANDLFKAARANYLEVLNTQKEALATQLELMETKEQQFQTIVNLYKSLGGGWR